MVSMLVSAVVAALAMAAGSTSPSVLAARIHPKLHQQLQQTQGTVDIVIDFKDTNTRQSLNDDPSLDRSKRISNMIQHLDRVNSKTQQEVMRALSQDAVSNVTRLWITSSLFVKGASKRLIEQVSQLNTVAEIRLPLVIFLDDHEPGMEINVNVHTYNESTLTHENDPELEIDVNVNNEHVSEWGVQKVQAPQVWKAGFTGVHVIVANIDSGVRATHQDLRDNFIGLSENGWYDPETKSADPYDPIGHGTHTMGIMVGQNGIGVAPGAKWMACKLSKHELDALKCAQFVVCPHNTKGENADCSKAPHIVSNSWAMYQDSVTFSNVIGVWRKAGIIPVFSAGNRGPACGTIKPPAAYESVISVGATAQNDSIAPFSGRGPTGVDGIIKPDIAAPGLLVRSASMDSDSSYGFKSGSSVAAPHVAGVIALMLSANDTQTFDQMKQNLFAGANTKTLVNTKRECGGIREDVFPNYVYGHGLVNAYQAIFRPTPELKPNAPVPTSRTPRYEPGSFHRIRFKLWSTLKELSQRCHWTTKNSCQQT